MATVSLPKLDYGKFSRQGEVMLAAGVVVILFVMLVPLPTFFLDIMLCVSISISLLVLITTMFMNSPLEFTIFPSLLLVTTLLRLALNVASTRLILLNGDQGVEAAGTVIRAFGEFVVGGSYVVGAVIFLILFILNKVVITAGTSRIAEVVGETVAGLVDGVTKLTNIEVSSMDEKQALNLRKMFLAMSRDIRVIIVKLADRLHNMRTLAALREDRRLFKARETMDVYAPLADRLGMSSIKWEH